MSVLHSPDVLSLHSSLVIQRGAQVPLMCFADGGNCHAYIPHGGFTRGPGSVTVALETVLNTLENTIGLQIRILRSNTAGPQ